MSSLSKNTKLWFWMSVGSALLHFTDNILRLDAYPDLSTLTATTLAMYGLVMLGLGLLGYVIFFNLKLKSGVILLLVYCLLNFIVLIHYTPSRLHGGFWHYGPEIHIFIWLEVLTSLVLLYYLSKSVKNIKQP